jgi:hypothetical protein
MPKCCGRNRDSRFCPDCGKKLGDDNGLQGQQAHCRKTERHHRALARNRARDIERAKSKGEETPDWWHNVKDGAETTANRWKAWGDGLANLIDPPTSPMP